MNIRDKDYSYVMNQMCKVGTHIFELGTYAEDYKVYESIITDKMETDSFGYLCVILQDVDFNIKVKKRIELLACGYHTHQQVFLDRESAENERIKRLNRTNKSKS